MSLITGQEALDALCARLKSAEFITVDTEFLREHTYYPQLCLIQVADDTEAHAIDPLEGDLDLTPVYDLMADPAIIKVMHACRQDVEIFFQATGAVPAPLFDSQIAAMVCGFGESAGYETLVKKIVGVSIDKSVRYTDWSRRPLSDEQLDYALSDVTYLRDIYRSLTTSLEGSGRAAWLDEEMAIVTTPETYRIDPYSQWQRLKLRSNRPRAFAVLREIAAWREIEAQDRNIPKRRVLKDEILLEIAGKPPRDGDAFDKLRGAPRGFGRSSAGKSLLEAIERALALPDDALPEPPASGARRKPTPAVAELLKVLLKIRCQETGVAPKLIASASEIEAWAADPGSGAAFLSGWRRQIFGNEAEKMLAGTLALSSRRGQIEIVELEPDD